MKLHDRVMLVSLHISRWAGTRTDKKVTSDVAKAHAVSERRAGTYRKHAVDIDAPVYKAVVTAYGELRTRHNFWTLPWGEDNARVLPAEHFEKYSEEMRVAKDNYEKACAAFIAEFPALKAAAKIELNGLYNEADYPKNIASKFGAETVIKPLPDAADFRVDLPDSAVAVIKANLERDLQRTAALAMRDPYKRLFECINRMVDRLKDPKGVFRDTLVSNLGELCEVLPGLNITQDPQLDELRRRAESLIVGVTAEALRESETVRAAVCAKAEEIQATMAAFMGTGEES